MRMHAEGCGSSEETFQSGVAELALADQWIIDGHYREVRQLIWRRAEVAVWLNYPMPVVALRVVKRFLRKRRAIASRADRPGEVPVAARPVSDKGASWKKTARLAGKNIARAQRLWWLPATLSER